ncbi:hypothetical protein EV146_11637 [Mesobacillus foraminis]|uniref:Uncharacterized protein n=1 Tax=Mesobacillus foraminis TaxID=279826 RepID=A0A4R2B181_9BACI|nr:hypothetical protein EV146_11637 [Mesobacillus foraminis]
MGNVPAFKKKKFEIKPHTFSEEWRSDDEFFVAEFEIYGIITLSLKKHREILVFLCFHPYYLSVCSCFFFKYSARIFNLLK